MTTIATYVVSGGVPGSNNDQKALIGVTNFSGLEGPTTVTTSPPPDDTSSAPYQSFVVDCYLTLAVAGTSKGARSRLATFPTPPRRRRLLSPRSIAASGTIPALAIPPTG